jgi:hypothetical protein
MLQSQMIHYIQILCFVEVDYKIFSNGPISHTIQYNVDSLWHTLIIHHAILPTEIGIH